MNSKTKLSILFILVLLIFITIESLNKKPENTPPNLQPLSELTGFLTGQSISAADFESNFECEVDNIKQVPQSESFQVIYQSEDSTFEDLLNRINFKDANLRFISFQNSEPKESFFVAPFEFFTDNFELDLESGGYCCNELNQNKVFKKGVPLLVFSDKSYEVCENPSSEEMIQSNVILSNTGWDLRYISSNENLNVSEDKEIESVWTFPLNSNQDAQKVFDSSQSNELNFDNQIYWINTQEKPNTNTQNSSSLTTNFDIAMENMSFGFNEIKVPVGQEITLNIENLDSVPHDFFIQGLDQGSEIIQASQSSIFKFAINEAGSYDVICNFHPSMQAKIVAE